MEEIIRNAVSEPLKEIGVKIYSVTYEKEDGVDTLFIRIESEEAVDTDLCQKCADIINPIVDSLNLGLENEYVLDICSKGIENE